METKITDGKINLKGNFCSRVAGTVVNDLNSDKVALTVVPVPSLAEQKRIVAKLEEILPLCDRLK